ncbi:uncharacterized protein E0L32_006915 [Thyridium curvatum]|uniref:Uncharacterized protein n=1 Tax=Thyridium curvatum TaxID=1093900 RepID=A0A507B600_9PEZI|nr:uncharacterized protein E0L32_006915 [Thyridium curvatum]TPX12268.1 hypothetical protein E0L32_006915 [Thyridium curvatum]
MRQRLDEYERGGMAATLEMQRAARSVALENRCLRAMLARRGVSSAEIDAFLRAGAPPPPPPSPPPDRAYVPSPPRPAYPYPRAAAQHPAPVAAPATRARQQQQPPPRDRPVGAREAPPSSRAPRLRPRPQDPRPSRASPSELEETPCDAAAEIISGIYGRGQAHAAEALVSLGCTQAPDCRVKISSLYQLLDNTG